MCKLWNKALVEQAEHFIGGGCHIFENNEHRLCEVAGIVDKTDRIEIPTKWTFLLTGRGREECDNDTIFIQTVGTIIPKVNREERTVHCMMPNGRCYFRFYHRSYKHYDLAQKIQALMAAVRAPH